MDDESHLPAGHAISAQLHDPSGPVGHGTSERCNCWHSFAVERQPLREPESIASVVPRAHGALAPGVHASEQVHCGSMGERLRAHVW